MRARRPNRRQTPTLPPPLVPVGAADVAPLSRFMEMEASAREASYAPTHQPEVVIDWVRNQAVIQNGVRVVAPLDRPFVHQVLEHSGEMERAECHSFEEYMDHNIHSWKNDFTPALVRRALVAPGVRLRMLPTESAASFDFYGLVGGGYRPTNQLAVRAAVIKGIGDLFPGEQVLSTGPFVSDYFGQIEEHFAPIGSRRRGEISAYLLLRYGRSNGYGSYLMDAVRLVTVCTNALRTIGKHSEEEWRHNNSEEVGSFVTRHLTRMVPMLAATDAAQQRAQSTRIGDRDALGLLRLLNAPGSSIGRVLDQLAIERRLYGLTEWALSQALTHVGTHDARALAARVGIRFLHVGTRVLDDGLGATLGDPVYTTQKGVYDSPLLGEEHVRRDLSW